MWLLYCGEGEEIIDSKSQMIIFVASVKYAWLFNYLYFYLLEDDKIQNCIDCDFIIVSLWIAFNWYEKKNTYSFTMISM